MPSEHRYGRLWRLAHIVELFCSIHVDSQNASFAPAAHSSQMIRQFVANAFTFRVQEIHSDESLTRALHRSSAIVLAHSCLEQAEARSKAKSIEEEIYKSATSLVSLDSTRKSNRVIHLRQDQYQEHCEAVIAEYESNTSSRPLHNDSMVSLSRHDLLCCPELMSCSRMREELRRRIRVASPSAITKTRSTSRTA